MADFGGGKHVHGRKEHRCAACYEVILKGEEHYHYLGMYGGDWQNWRMHEECYEAWDADGCEEFIPGEFPRPVARRSGTPEQQTPPPCPSCNGAGCWVCGQTGVATEWRAIEVKEG